MLQARKQDREMRELLSLQASEARQERRRELSKIRPSESHNDIRFLDKRAAVKLSRQVKGNKAVCHMKNKKTTKETKATKEKPPSTHFIIKKDGSFAVTETTPRQVSLE